LFIFIVTLGVFAGNDLLGWSIKTSVWTDASKALSPISEKYATVKGEVTKIDGLKVTLKKGDGAEATIEVKDASGLKVGDTYEKKGVSGIAALLFTYLAMLVIMGVGARLLGADLVKFIIGFTIVFWLSYLCYLAGHYAYIAATTPKEMTKFGISWALKLTGEAGLIIALIAGLIVGNFLPKAAENLKEATRPELYIKTAIVIMGAGLGLKAAESLGLATAVMFRGLCAIVEAYLIYWAVVYWMARKYFGFSKEWAAPLASGISICGVSAAIATGGAIRARPIVPIMVSSLVVVFAVVELVILPWFAKVFLWQEPLVAGAWMGLAVKTDGAAVASGAITDAWIRAEALQQAGINYKEGWMLMTATTVKMFIDIFIGVWAFILAVIWCTKIECKPGEKVGVGEIWNRFPKFVIGYVITFFLLLFICLPASKTANALDKELVPVKQEIAAAEKQKAEASAALAAAKPKQKSAAKKAVADIDQKLAAANAKKADIEAQTKPAKAVLSKAKLATDEGNIFRVMFFVLTFFTIGLVSNFKKLWEEGIGRLAAVYVIALFGFIIWVGLIISWIFFHGVKPPLAG